ncbi:MAG: hypothetical protein VR72_01485 [Clostridiaceae bacterium BRH_c20a]|nr:MAG: hypothetical protein VR72_01485 [Clostridiaceae bacterium BRH_c20a]
MYKKSLSFLIIILMVVSLVLTGCGNESSNSKQDSKVQVQEQGPEKITLKLSHPTNESHPYHIGAKKFSELVNQKTNGQVDIEIFPNNSLGGPKETAQGLQLGTIDLGIAASAHLVSYNKNFGVLDIPFLFKDPDNAHKVLDSEVGTNLGKSLEEKNIKVLGYFDGGFRNLFNSKKNIKISEDMKGLRVRVMDSEVYIDMFKAVNASPTVLPWDDLYTSIQQGIVDAGETGISQIYTQKFFEVAKNVSLTRHTYTAAPLMVSLNKFNQLPTNVQEAIIESAKEAIPFQYQANEESEKQALEKLKEEGVNIEEQVDLASFQKQVQPVWEKYRKNFGELIDEIIEAQN